MFGKGKREAESFGRGQGQVRVQKYYCGIRVDAVEPGLLLVSLVPVRWEKIRSVSQPAALEKKDGRDVRLPESVEGAPCKLAPPPSKGRVVTAPNTMQRSYFAGTGQPQSGSHDDYFQPAARHYCQVVKSSSQPCKRG